MGTDWERRIAAAWATFDERSDDENRALIDRLAGELPAGSAEGGFGVRLVSEVADSWGWEHVRGGKVVWAQFDLGSQ